MFPEGNPSDVVIQEILFWQHCTMEAMYAHVGGAIMQHGRDAVPTDYLRFFCLGKREAPEMVPDGLAEPAGAAATVRQTLRHPIYVHSKVQH